MSRSPHQQLAEDANALLAAQTFEFPITPERKYDPTAALDELTNPRFTTVVSSVRKASVSRKTTQHDVDVDFALQKKPERKLPPDVDPLDLLVDQVSQFLLRSRVGDWTCIGVEYKQTAVWHPEHLKEKNLFTSVITATFRRIGP